MHCFVEEKEISSIFKALNSIFGPDGAQLFIEKAQSGQKGTFMPYWGI